MYGSDAGVKNHLGPMYDKLLTGTGSGQLTLADIAEFRVDVNGRMDTLLSSVCAPPVVAPTFIVAFLNHICDELVCCEILQRQLLPRTPKEAPDLKMYCIDPITELENIIAKHAGILNIVAPAPGGNLMLSNTKGFDRKATIEQTQGGQQVKPGTMDTFGTEDFIPGDSNR